MKPWWMTCAAPRNAKHMKQPARMPCRTPKAGHSRRQVRPGPSTPLPAIKKSVATSAGAESPERSEGELRARDEGLTPRPQREMRTGCGGLAAATAYEA